ncbi:RDD family protein [Nocardioides speluncae]|uniref:RDD family protein n=1 Tax=Nocardioides speluncae TaxID=2670337 RepID=UPI000D68B08F|nr:RDD family protein [Nocardioides speluncae]
MTEPATEFATLTADDLVTGEAVALDLPPAGLGTRIASGLIDILATIALLIAAYVFLMIATARADAALQWAAYVGVTILVFLVYPTAFETLSRGRTLGKYAMGLRTVRDDGGPISAQHALVRALIGYVEIYAFTGVPAFFSALLSERGKRLGDYAAGTYVVRERVHLILPLPTQMPWPLQQWAAAADIAALPTGLALAVRQYLGRAHQISPQARAALGHRLAEQVAAYVAPKPPPGTPPDAFLAAVIAARRDRDAARLRREADFRQRLTQRR